MIEKQSLQVDLARRDFYPDFNVQYMWQRTTHAIRAYYMLSVGCACRFPRTQTTSELAQAEAEKLRAGSELQANRSRWLRIAREYVLAQQPPSFLKIHREGLSLQSRSEFQAALATYNQTNSISTLLAAFLDVLRLDEEYCRTSPNRDAIARLEQITGLSLR